MSPQSPIEIRKEMRAKRAALNASERLRAAHGLSKQLDLIPELLVDMDIAGYFAVNCEMGLHFWHSQMQLRGQHYYLPKIIAPDMPAASRRMPIPSHEHAQTRTQSLLRFGEVGVGDELVNNRFGIPEPGDSVSLRDARDLDVILLPLTAFDRSGYRLGMGGGYYDRTLQFLADAPRPSKPLLVGVAYAFQEVAQLDQEPWDIKLDFIATEREVIQCFVDQD